MRVASVCSALLREVNLRWDAAEDFVRLFPSRRIDAFRPHNDTPRSVTLPHPWFFERTPGGGHRITNAHTSATIHVRGEA